MRRALTLSALALAAASARAEAPRTQAAPFDQQVLSQLGHAGGLTADDVAKKAADTSFEVQAKSEEVAIASAQVEQAFAAFFPRLSLSAGYTRLSHIDQQSLGNIVVAPGHDAGPLPEGAQLVNVPLAFELPDNSTVLRAQLTVPVSDYLLRLSHGYAAATRSEEAARLSEKAARLKVQTDARLAYYQWVRAKLQTVVAQAALQQAGEHLGDVKASFDIGSASRADVLRIESQQAQAQLLVERSQNLARLLEERLRVAMHVPGGTAFEIGEALPEQLGAVEGLGEAPQVLEQAQARRLEVRALGESAGALKEAERTAKAGYLPRLDAFADVTDANPNQRIFPQQEKFTTTWAAGVQLSWTPNDAAVAHAQKKQAGARVAQLEAQKNQLLDGLRTEVFQAVQDVKESELALGTTQQQLAATEEAYRVRHALFRAGRATATELADAQTELTRARLENLNARVDVRLARVRFTHAAGLDAE